MNSDAELIDLVQAGDVEAFAVLVRRYERLVRATVLRAVHDRHVAEDVVQDTFLSGFESLGTLRNASKFGSWLLAIARNQAARHARQAIRHEVCVADMANV